jgi:hypothetical protein
MVQGEETTAYNLFQLAINKEGILRGNYYNALTDSTEPVYTSRINGRPGPSGRKRPPSTKRASGTWRMTRLP